MLVSLCTTFRDGSEFRPEIALRQAAPAAISESVSVVDPRVMGQEICRQSWGEKFAASLHERIRRTACDHTQVLKNTCVEHRSTPSSSQNYRQVLSQVTINGSHLSNGRLPHRSAKHIAQFAKHSVNGTAVDEWICAVQIAKRLHQPKLSCLADIPVVRLAL